MANASVVYTLFMISRFFEKSDFSFDYNGRLNNFSKLLNELNYIKASILASFRFSEIIFFGMLSPTNRPDGKENVETSSFALEMFQTCTIEADSFYKQFHSHIWAHTQIYAFQSALDGKFPGDLEAGL